MLCVCSDGSVGEEHNSEGCSHSSWWKIFSELCSNNTVVTVSLDDSAPDSSEFGVVYSALCLVDVSDSFAKVELSVFLVVHALDVQQSELFVLSGLTSLETSEHSLGVQSKITEMVNIKWSNI